MINWFYKWTKMTSILSTPGAGNRPPTFLVSGERMKNLMLRSSALLACALSLAACSGGNGNLYLGGYVVNMTKPGLKLANNNGTPIEIPAGAPGGSQPFQFEGLEADDRFNITVVNQPEGSECIGSNNVGKMGGYSVGNVQFLCYNLPKNLGGTLSRPLPYAIVLNNGADQVRIEPGQTSFTFTTKNAAGKTVGTVGHGEPYGVTVLDKGQASSCTVQNGSGTMSNDFNGIIVTCQ
jgi:hypothetical protein